MSGLFGGSKPKVQPIVKPPTIDDAAIAAEDELKKKRRKGRLDSIAAGKLGNPGGGGGIASKALGAGSKAA